MLIIDLFKKVISSCRTDLIVVLCIPVVFMIINIKMAFGRILLIRLDLMTWVELRF